MYMASRKQKLDEILELLKKNDGKMTFGELFRHFVSKYGTSRKTFWSYLKDLISAELIAKKSIVISGVSSKDGTVVGGEDDIIFEIVDT